MAPDLKQQFENYSTMNTQQRYIQAMFERQFLPARRYAGAVLAVIVCLSACLSVHPSVISWCSTKPSITQTTPYDSPKTLVI